jgi:predicted dehydrogenase
MASMTPRVSRRIAMKHWAAAGFAFPALMRTHATAAPSETLYHASFGASGMAGSDIGSLTASPYLKLIAVADVDLRNLGQVKKRFPDVTIYQDWRELLDKEKHLNSVNVSTPDHMHGSITMRALQQGLHVYTQKPLTQTIFEARQVTRVAHEKKLVTQMGIQIHSHEVHRTIVAIIQSGMIGRVKEVHSWSGKHWGDKKPRPNRVDPVPKDLNWSFWLGVASERPYLAHYYHPGEWRKRLDFGTGTFGDMGCHILDPVYTSLGLTAPSSIRSEGGAPNEDNWGLDSRVRYVFPGTKHTTETLTLLWYDGGKRPSADVTSLIGKRHLSGQGSIYIGKEGVLYAPYIDEPVLMPADKFKDVKLPNPGGDDHYLQFVDACRGNGKTSAPFEYSGPLTESVLLGCLATRFPKMTLEWDPAALKVTNISEANAFVRRRCRKGWELAEIA